MAKVELKKPVIDEIAANIADAQSVVIVDYCGLTVEQDTNPTDLSIINPVCREMIKTLPVQRQRGFENHSHREITSSSAGGFNLMPCGTCCLRVVLHAMKA